MKPFPWAKFPFCVNLVKKWNGCPWEKFPLCVKLVKKWKGWPWAKFPFYVKLVKKWNSTRPSCQASTLDMPAWKKNLMKLPLSLREITSIFRKDFRGEISKIGNHNMKEVMPSWQALLIDSGASNPMMDERDSLSYLDTIKSIPIHMGYDSTIISEGQGTVDLENDYFANVLYVPCLESNILSFY